MITAASSIPQREPTARNVIRWAIGSSDGLRSSTWRLWGNNKGDIYVAPRSLCGVTKASFHRDGRCQVGFTENYATTASRRFGVQSRHWQKWRLPNEPLVRVLQILVPHSELRSFPERKPRNITWLPAPPEGSLGVISIFVTALANNLPLPNGADMPILVGKLPTFTRVAWVVYGHHPVDHALEKRVDQERAKLKHLPGVATLPLNARAALWEDREDHDRHVLELACH